MLDRSLGGIPLFRTDTNMQLTASFEVVAGDLQFELLAKG